ncbi:endonuclease domain-containing protein [[Kitasatospora] papulosa]|uniref:endonuclease domain-containing protein n=1 Tax=[Kitasatospora] papulosa TaxID=1464011 RepID=UPI003624B543
MTNLRPIGPTPWRVVYKPTDRSRERAALYPCALAGLSGACTPPHYTAVNIMVWDHCHAHGYIRGPLCGRHNHTMWHYDNGREHVICNPDVIEYARRCSGCCGPW